MPFVVVVGGIIQCKHMGTVKLSSGDSRLEISGSAALTAGMEAGISFAPGSPGLIEHCPFTTGGSPSPCTATLTATTGVSELLTIGGVGVLLDNATGQTFNTPLATWSIAEAGQTLVRVDN
jgi:hypothetical protein